jgi:hypothetical protein
MWTKEIPPQPGWYWYRYNTFSPSGPVVLRVRSIDSKMFVTGEDQFQGPWLKAAELYKGEWWSARLVAPPTGG